MNGVGKVWPKSWWALVNRVGINALAHRLGCQRAIVAYACGRLRNGNEFGMGWDMRDQLKKHYGWTDFEMPDVPARDAAGHFWDDTEDFGRMTKWLYSSRCARDKPGEDRIRKAEARVTKEMERWEAACRRLRKAGWDMIEANRLANEEIDDERQRTAAAV